MNPSEKRTSGNLEGRSEMRQGVDIRVAQRLEVKDGAEEVRLISGEPGEAGQNTHWLDTSRSKQRW